MSVGYYTSTGRPTIGLFVFGDVGVVYDYLFRIFCDTYRVLL